MSGDSSISIAVVSTSLLSVVSSVGAALLLLRVGLGTDGRGEGRGGEGRRGE